MFGCLPSTKDGTRLTDAALSCAVGLRLGADVATCSTCVFGERLDPLSDHALSCGPGIRRHARHKEVNAQIQRALAAAGVSATLEPVGLDMSTGKRPDGATTLPYSRGRAMAWNATIFHTCASTYLSSCAQTAGAAASLAEARKNVKYAELRDRIEFRPVNLETLGAFGPGALAFFDDVALRIRARGVCGAVRLRLYRQIAAVIQLGNAACISEVHSCRN